MLVIRQNKPMPFKTEILDSRKYVGLRQGTKRKGGIRHCRSGNHVQDAEPIKRNLRYDEKDLQKMGKLNQKPTVQIK